jgi:hypothetical protein
MKYIRHFSWENFKRRDEHEWMSHWGRFSPSTSVSLANYSTDCSTLIIIDLAGLVRKASSGLSNSRLGSTPPLSPKEKT